MSDFQVSVRIVFFSINRAGERFCGWFRQKAVKALSIECLWVKKRKSAFFFSLCVVLDMCVCEFLCVSVCHVGGQVIPGRGSVAVKRLARLQATIQQYNVRDTPDGALRVGGWSRHWNLANSRGGLPHPCVCFHLDSTLGAQFSPCFPADALNYSFPNGTRKCLLTKDNHISCIQTFNSFRETRNFYYKALFLSFKLTIRGNFISSLLLLSILYFTFMFHLCIFIPIYFLMCFMFHCDVMIKLRICNLENFLILKIFNC